MQAQVLKRFAHGVASACWLLAASGARAQDLAVVESAPQDRASADKLSELLREPVLRLTAPSDAAPDSETPRCQSGARRELILDSAHHVVRLVRCRDGTTLSRALAPDEAARTPYLGAFIAAELLAIDRELEAVETQSQPGTPPGAASEPGTARAESAQPAPPSAAPVSASTAPAAPPEPAPSPVGLRISLGADLAVWGPPFALSLRPSLGLGLSLQPTAASPQVVLELYASAFGRGELTRGSERLTLTRSDAQLRAGALYPLWDGRLSLGGFGFARGSLTGAQYSGLQETSMAELRWGLGAGLEADVRLTAAFALYVQALLDLATSRSEYRVAGVAWTKDPVGLAWIGAGVVLRISP